MKTIKKDSIFKKGVWIKEQQGTLTMGSLDENGNNIMVVPKDLSSKIIEFENDMIDALYGDERIAFIPDIIDIKKLLSNIKKQLKGKDIRISYSGSIENAFKGNYDDIFNLLVKFVLSSSDQPSKDERNTTIYINASLLQDHLCIIYRDSDSISKPAKLVEEFHFIKNVLKGKISYNATSKNRLYYDIMIPSKT